MNRIKELVASFNFSSTAFAVGNDYAGWETDEIIAYETFRNLGFSLLCVFVVTALLLVQPKSCLLVFTCVALTIGNYLLTILIVYLQLILTIFDELTELRISIEFGEFDEFIGYDDFCDFSEFGTFDEFSEFDDFFNFWLTPSSDNFMFNRN